MLTSAVDREVLANNNNATVPTRITRGRHKVRNIGERVVHIIGDIIRTLIILVIPFIIGI